MARRRKNNKLLDIAIESPWPVAAGMGLCSFECDRKTGRHYLYDNQYDSLVRRLLFIKKTLN